MAGVGEEKEGDSTIGGKNATQNQNFLGVQNILHAVLDKVFHAY